jgi:transcription termination factor Rho
MFKKDILKAINKKDFSHKKKQIKIDKVVDLSQLGFSFLEQVNAFKPF